MPKNDIMVICAHNDDHAFGAGGTLAKYAEEGKKITAIIFSYGAGSHPWMKEKFIEKTRIKEAEKADQIMGVENTIYLDINEKNFMAEIEEKKIKQKILDLIKKTKPSKIFTHSIDDPHPNHQAVYKTVREILLEIKSVDVYMFDVWNPLNIRKRNSARLVVDVTNSFKKKIAALKCHKSQSSAFVSLFLNVYVKAWLYGLNYDVKFAEIFYRMN